MYELMMLLFNLNLGWDYSLIRGLSRWLLAIPYGMASAFQEQASKENQVVAVSLDDLAPEVT